MRKHTIRLGDLYLKGPNGWVDLADADRFTEMEARAIAKALIARGKTDVVVVGPPDAPMPPAPP